MYEKLLSQLHRLADQVRRHLRREEGQGLVEYALILALIAIFVVVALKFLQPQISNTLNTMAMDL